MSQLRMLAATATQPLDASVSREHPPPAPCVEEQGSNNDSPPPRLVGLRRTSSFLQLPSFLPRAHTISISDADVGGERNFNNNADAIDEMSPDEDERIAESVIRNGLNRKLFPTCLRPFTHSLYLTQVSPRSTTKTQTRVHVGRESGFTP